MFAFLKGGVVLAVVKVIVIVVEKVRVMVAVTVSRIGVEIVIVVVSNSICSKHCPSCNQTL